MSRAPIPLVDLQAQVAQIWTEIDQAIESVFRRGQFILGPEVESFEQELAAYCGAPYAVGVASGTDALELTLRACEIGPGDEVIVPAFTFMATAFAVSLVPTPAKTQSYSCAVSKQRVGLPERSG